jgi:hypothetical protein
MPPAARRSARWPVLAREPPGFWECMDLETGIIFTARERWFIERADDQRAG